METNNDGTYKSSNIAGMRFGRLVALKATNQRDKSNGSVIWDQIARLGLKGLHGIGAGISKLFGDFLYWYYNEYKKGERQNGKHKC